MPGSKHKPHRARIDSVAGAMEVMAVARVRVEPPASVPLADDELVQFRAIVEEYAGSAMSPHTIHVAALVSRIMADLERQSRRLREEDMAAQDLPSDNKRRATVLKLAHAMATLRRSLNIHGRAKEGDPEDTAGRRARARALAEQAGALPEDEGEDDFLARPN